MAWLALASVSLLLAACGTTPGAQAPDGSGANGATASSRPSDVFFPQRRPGPDAGPTAAMGGKLVLDEGGCLRVRPQRGPAYVPLWPANLRVETEGGTVRLKDEEGRAVAEVGKKVYMDGGQVGLSKEVVSPSTARELRSRCPGDIGDYWIATDVSRTLGIPPG